MKFIRKISVFFENVFLLPVYFYRRFISPLKPPCCRFRPSCSKYCVEAIKEWGIIIGSVLTVWRLLRCNPFSKGGYDPVPKRKHR
jgi:putative membrane protein insertion efficiency factor